MLGSMYFAGTTVFCLVVSRLGDIYGRKWPVRISSILALPTHLALLCSNNLSLTTFLFFVLGSLGPGKCQVSFVYASELVPEKYRAMIGSLTLFTDSATMIIVPTYHRFFTKNWVYFHAVSFALNIISAIALFWFPESPKYLIGKKKFKEA